MSSLTTVPLAPESTAITTSSQPSAPIEFSVAGLIVCRRFNFWQHFSLHPLIKFERCFLESPCLDFLRAMETKLSPSNLRGGEV